jgi:vesicle-fusing ATPase
MVRMHQLTRWLRSTRAAKVIDVVPFMTSRATTVTWCVEPNKPPRGRKKIPLDGALLATTIAEKYADHMVGEGQSIVIDFTGTKYVISCSGIEMSIGGDIKTVQAGMLAASTTCYFDEKMSNPLLEIQGAPKKPPELFKKEMNLSKLGIGGLDEEFSEVFRRAFSTRMFPQAVIERMGIKHVKGVLLYGPPGTGKTLIARRIGEMLNAKEPKIVNGPEILNKYVGESEAKIRELFADADADMAEFGDDSELHIIIFDEIDAICKQRGSGKDGTGVGDTVVNQMLSKMDGVTAINNILIVGMTNRKDMIDSALLRPGRFEVHIEIGLPDEKGRHQILNIHTSKMLENGLMDADIDVLSLAGKTKNYSGAEIEGLVKSACSYALDRKVNLDLVQSGKRVTTEDMMAVCVTQMDFERALDEVRPAFGSESDALNEATRLGIIDYGPKFQQVLSTCKLFVEQVASSDKTPLMGVLLEGESDTGKSALAAHLSLLSGYPFIKMVTADMLLGYPSSRKCDMITRVFEDAHKSPRSIVILDGLERLLEYVPIGPRFNNEVLQTLMVLLKKPPPKQRKLLVFASTSALDILESMGLVSAFTVSVRVPTLETAEIFEVFKQANCFAESDIEACANVFVEPIGKQEWVRVSCCTLALNCDADGSWA